MHPGKRVSSTSKAECLFGALGAVLTPQQPVHASEIGHKPHVPCTGSIELQSDMLLLISQGELCFLVLPECVWTQKHLYPHPGPR